MKVVPPSFTSTVTEVAPASIEFSISSLTTDEGLSKAIDVLNRVMIKEEKPCGMRWA